MYHEKGSEERMEVGREKEHMWHWSRQGHYLEERGPAQLGALGNANWVLLQWHMGMK